MNKSLNCYPKSFKDLIVDNPVETIRLISKFIKNDEDSVQGCYLHLLKIADRYNNQYAASTFIGAVAKQYKFNEYKKKSILLNRYKNIDNDKELNHNFDIVDGQDLLKNLDDNSLQYEIICKRFLRGWTLEKIAKSLDRPLTKERVRQILKEYLSCLE